MDIKEILAGVKGGCTEIIDEARIEDLIRNYYEKGENFYVKTGFDPTAPDLHLGHSVVLSKMAFLQKHGARVQFLIGDFTGQIGDPGDKNATRKKLSQEEMSKNAKTYESQVFKILNKNKTDTVFNSKWLNELDAAGVVELTSTFNVARMSGRENFTKRFKEQSSISIYEFLYPLSQGYDSVALKSDIEMGGTDQKSNLLMGRTLQRIYDIKKEQAIIMMPLLEGFDGVNKMSKSLNSYIGVTENVKDIYAKILSISDGLMLRYYELLSKKSLKEIETTKENIQDGSLHPKIVKENLALELVGRFHSKEPANEAKAESDRVHSVNALSSEIAEFELSSGNVWLARALVGYGLENSTSTARRAIVTNSVSVDSQKVRDEQTQLELGEYILQIEERKFARLKVEK